ncbi:MAG: flagellar basal body rod protein FlgB [Desulfobacterota bacterium]|nr:flagellar basal body rod protein FlgB [Thermodesulfobacteriota bacterium]
MDRFQIKRELFDHTIGLLQKSLNLRSLRHRILSDNIANADNPEHLRREIPFREILLEAMETRPSLALRRTHPEHLPGGLEEVFPVHLSSGIFQMDQEMAKLAENNLLFQAGVQALLKKFEGLKHVISEGGR